MRTRTCRPRTSSSCDPQAVTDHAYGSIDATAQTAKFLIDAYYGEAVDHSYFVGCSTGGRQGMVFSQNFPDYLDGIVAGDPVYDLEAIALSEDWGVKAIEAITPTPIQKLPDGSPVLYPALPAADQNLAEMALKLEAALRRPSSDNVAPPVQPEAPPAPPARPPRSETAAPAPQKTSFENLEDEMASLLGRPKTPS